MYKKLREKIKDEYSTKYEYVYQRLNRRYMLEYE